MEGKEDPTGELFFGAVLANANQKILKQMQHAIRAGVKECDLVKKKVGREVLHHMVFTPDTFADHLRPAQQPIPSSARASSCFPRVSLRFFVPQTSLSLVQFFLFLRDLVTLT